MLLKNAFIIFFLLAATANLPNKPRVSIITSVFNGDSFIREFLIDITQQTIFDQCELLMINANSPGAEEPIILEYAKQYPNIRYIKLERDPGLYGVWNLGVKLANAAYVTNANLDDRLAFNCYEVHANTLDQNPDIDLVYSDHYVSRIPNITFDEARSQNFVIWNFGIFSLKNLLKSCLPNNHPMWRTSMHDKAGFFNEAYKSVGDLEMWLRAATHGSIFLKVPQVFGVFYLNPSGLSRDKAHKSEFNRVMREYQHLK